MEADGRMGKTMKQLLPAIILSIYVFGLGADNILPLLLSELIIILLILNEVKDNSFNMRKKMEVKK